MSMHRKNSILYISMACVVGLFLPALGLVLHLNAKDPVAVSAINYTGRDLNGYLFENPDNGKVAGGPGLNPYEGGGTMCCYSLPRKWHKGIKVKLRYDWWAGTSDIRDYQYVTVELPPYPTDEPGMLWALLYEDGSVEVVASAVDPGHPKWPGKIKHWPVPSREYKLKLWQFDYDELLDRIRRTERPLNTDKETLESRWNTYRQLLSSLEPDEQQKLQRLKGPEDPGFIEYLIDAQEKDLKEDRLRAEYMLKLRP